MGRPFAACLGSIALATQITTGFILGTDVDTILIRSILSLLTLSIVGWVIGKLADDLVRENIEAHYRRQIAALKEKQNTEQPTNVA